MTPAAWRTRSAGSSAGSPLTLLLSLSVALCSMTGLRLAPELDAALPESLVTLSLRGLGSCMERERAEGSKVNGNALKSGMVRGGG